MAPSYVGAEYLMYWKIWIGASVSAFHEEGISCLELFHVGLTLLLIILLLYAIVFHFNDHSGALRTLLYRHLQHMRKADLLSGGY